MSTENVTNSQTSTIGGSAQDVGNFIETSSPDTEVATPVGKASFLDMEDMERSPQVEIEAPKRSLAYWAFIISLCFPIALGGLLPGWDSGITAGFINSQTLRKTLALTATPLESIISVMSEWDCWLLFLVLVAR